MMPKDAPMLSDRECMIALFKGAAMTYARLTGEPCIVSIETPGRVFVIRGEPQEVRAAEAPVALELSPSQRF
jgi:hypothetical protein